MEYKKNEKKQKQHLLWQPIVSDKISVKWCHRGCFLLLEKINADA